MREIICGIYKITNQLNKKFYIGQSVDIHKRWLTHCRDTDNCPIHKAIQKYGKENFSLEILEECSKEELNEKEIFWIKKYNGYESSDCYNATRGGEGASHPIKISQEDLEEDNVSNLLTIVNNICEYNYIINSKTTLEDIQFLLQANKILEENKK